MCYLFVPWSQQAFSGVLYYSGIFFFFGGGGVLFWSFFSLHDIFGLLRMSRVYFGVMVYPQFFRYITLCLTKWPIFTLLSWSRHVFFRTFDQKGFLSILSHVVYQILIDTYVHVLYVLLLLLHFLFNPINNISVIVGGCCCCFFCCDNSFFIHLPYPLSYELYMLL